MKPVTKTITNEETRSQVLRIFEELTERFETEWLYIKLKFSDFAHPTDPDCAADTESKWEYRMMAVTVYLPSVADQTDGQLRHILAHELIHGIVAPMESLIKESLANTRQCELAVESLTRTFLKAASLDDLD